MKRSSLLLLAALILLSATTAQAEISGRVQGRIRVRDNRFGNNFVPVQRVIVSVRALAAPAGGQLNVINPTSFAVTDANGNFDVAWADLTRDALPSRLRVTVEWESSASPGSTGDAHPPVLFRVARVSVGGDVPVPEVFDRDITQANPNLGNLSAAAGDESAAYLTTDEFFQDIVIGSPVSGRMRGLVVKTRVPGFNMSFGVTPLSREVFVAESVPFTQPRTLAHELGHAVTWNALGLDLAPINPLTDYVFPPGGLTPSWRRDTREFSKAAFLEGMADAWALEWRFGSNPNAFFTSGDLTFNVERARVLNSAGNVVLDCETALNAHEFPFCHTAAIRDLLDEDDGVNFARNTIMSTLDRFGNCLGNGCRNELGVDALNHHDFRCNASGSGRRALIKRVWEWNNINGGPASSCSP